MSFLKYIVKNGSSIPADWLLNPQSAFSKSSIDEQAYFLLNQSLMMNYLMRMYGNKGLPILLNQYNKHLIGWYREEFIDKNKLSSTPYSKLAAPCIDALLYASLSKLDLDACLRVLSESRDVPSAIDESFYVTYATFVNKTYESSYYVDSSDIDKMRSFSGSGEISLPSFQFKGSILTVDYNIKFDSYKYSYKACKDLSEVGAMPNSGLAFLTGYDWSKLNFSGVMGVLASLCLEKDINAIPTESNLFGYWDVYRTVVPSSRPFEKEKSLALSSEISSQKRRIMSFLTTIRKEKNVKFDDPSLLNQYISGLSDDATQKLSTFLSTTDPSTISTESYASFINSKFGSFDELDIVKRATTRFDLMDADGDKVKAKETEENEQEDDPDKPNDKGDTKGDTKDQETTPGKSDNQDESTDNAESEGNQDSPDDKAPTESSDAPDAQEPKETQNKLPPLPKLDDKKGIKLQLSTGESASTVLYREELNTYLNNLLANPPPQLSVQTVLALKRLRTYWLHMLSVKDLYDFVSAMIKLPKSISLNNKRGN